MPNDLGLEALAHIQALDARKRAHKFRNDWLEGRPMPSQECGVAWMREQLGAPQEAQLIGLNFTETLDMSLARWKQGGCKWGAKSDSGRILGLFPTKRPSAMWELGVLVCILGEAFGREWINQGAAFVLANAVPVLSPVPDWWGVHKVRTGGLRNVSGPVSDEIVLFIRPQATFADVTTAYRHAQERIWEAVRWAPRERVKPMTSERMRDLAILGGRVALHDFATWQDALDTYESEHPSETTYRDRNIGRFRRDVRMAYERVTALELNFQPDRRGTAPEVRMHWREQSASSPAQDQQEGNEGRKQ